MFKEDFLEWKIDGELIRIPCLVMNDSFSTKPVTVDFEARPCPLDSTINCEKSKFIVDNDDEFSLTCDCEIKSTESCILKRKMEG